MDLTGKDIVVFPDIAGSYAIRNKYRDTPSVTNFEASEWFIFGWEGYKIGTYYEGYNTGVVYIPSQHSGFDDCESRKMPNIKSAVTYAWLMTSQRMLKKKRTKLLDDEISFSKEGFVIWKYGVRAFMGGINKDCVYSLFNSKDQFVGEVIDDDGFFMARKVGFRDQLDKMPFSGPNKEGVLRTLMYCCGFGHGS